MSFRETLAPAQVSGKKQNKTKQNKTKQKESKNNKNNNNNKEHFWFEKLPLLDKG